MGITAPYLLNTGFVPLPANFLIPVYTTPERYQMMISALWFGGEMLYGEEEILHLCDFLNALPEIREETLLDYDTLLAQIAAAQDDADAALAALAALQYEKTVERFADSAVITGGTPTFVESTNYRYNFVRYTTALNAQFEWYFMADLSLGASITVLYVSGTGGGNIDLSINGTYIASKDFSTGGANNKATWTETLAASVHGKGRHTIRLKCGGSGSVGGAFAMSITKVWINAT